MIYTRFRVTVLLTIIAVGLWLCASSCDETPTPTPQVATHTETGASVSELQTQVANLRATLTIVEPLVDELDEAVGRMWDECCWPGTATAQAPTVTPANTPEPGGSAMTPEPEFVALLLPLSADTYIFAYQEGPYGAQGSTNLGYKDQNRLLLKVDVSPVPTGVDIVSATMRLWVYSWAAVPIDAVVYAVYRPWADATWNSASAGNPWAAPGCSGSGPDRDEEISSAQRIYGIEEWVALDVTLPVRRWISGLPNNGVLVCSNPAESGNMRFRSMESSDTEHIPVLLVVYRNPAWH